MTEDKDRELAERIHEAALDNRAVSKELRELSSEDQAAFDELNARTKKNEQVINDALKEADNPALVVETAIDEREAVIMENITVEDLQARDAELEL